MRIKTIDFQKAKSLSIVQFCSEQVDSFNYVSVGYAIDKNLIEIKEINQAGSVNTIFVINKSNDYVFFMDGDVLKGAKQNRVLNTSILVKPNSKTEIPVSCVEAGRWRFRTSRFRDSDFVASPTMRSEKAIDVLHSLKSNRGFMANQGNVWNKVDFSAKKLGVYSDTSDYSEIFEKKQKYFKEYLDSFVANSDANGLAIFMKNKLLSIDLFNRRDIFSEYFPKIIKGAAIEAYNMKEENGIAESEAFYKLNNFFDKYENIEKVTHNSVGAGVEKRFENKFITGFELEYEGKTIHFAAMQLEENL
ncbi:MAG: hypothetical protein N2490_03215 [Ignavibacteria bacterium]|nr:hypothetical protein [Ignavibacteria bacterium]